MHFPDGRYKAIAVRDWNGKEMHDGQILINCWNDFRHMVVLLALGDLQSLGPNLEDTVACHRDLRSHWARVAPRIYYSEREWKNSMRRSGCACFYLFDMQSEEWQIWGPSGLVKNIDSYKV